MSRSNHRPLFIARGLLALAAAVGLAAGAGIVPASAAPPGDQDTGVARAVQSAAKPGGGKPAPSTTVAYVALGDSYTAGQGAGPYLDTTCYRSTTSSYPIFADTLNSRVDLKTNQACSGASTSDIPAQLSALPTTVDPSTVGLVTLTVGGIDAGSNQVATACPNGTVTQACIDLLTLTTAEQADLTTKLTTAYKTVKAKFPKAKVAAAGYPHFFTGIYLFSDFPRRLNASIDTLDSVIKSAAAANGVTFVDVRDEFNGHEIGSFSGQWINYGSTDPNEDFHPNASGYRYGYYQALVNDRVLP
ncbi:SGNH/GDSL hydrolase family protein [Sinomonas flava]|uniref:SGNH/GDSL hydrolase family protein n=1 Tax=Sinomonas flava TaxID=496857 RepID=A0ABP5NR18_9MICC